MATILSNVNPTHGFFIFVFPHKRTKAQTDSTALNVLCVRIPEELKLLSGD